MEVDWVGQKGILPGRPSAGISIPEAAIWGIYFSQTPTYFLLVYFLYLLTRRGGRLARITVGLAAALFAVGLAAPLVARGKADRYTWPQGKTVGGEVNITGARLVDTSAGQKSWHGENRGTPRPVIEA